MCGLNGFVLGLGLLILLRKDAQKMLLIALDRRTVRKYPSSVEEETLGESFIIDENSSSSVYGLVLGFSLIELSIKVALNLFQLGLYIRKKTGLFSTDLEQANWHQISKKPVKMQGQPTS